MLQLEDLSSSVVDQRDRTRRQVISRFEFVQKWCDDDREYVDMALTLLGEMMPCVLIHLFCDHHHLHSGHQIFARLEFGFDTDQGVRGSLAE